jgi:hypothetical protein
LNVGMPCLGFMLSYIQPESINFTSNHRYEYRCASHIIVEHTHAEILVKTLECHVS